MVTTESNDDAESKMSLGQILRRNPPGTKSVNFYNWPDQSFDEMDSTLAVQQYIQQAIRDDHTDVDMILTAPEGQDEGVWKYEHLRQFCLELNGLAVKLQQECTAETCSQMTATEQWIFLCAAHKTPKECPAIDYTRHTLDGAACLLNSNKYFPSRVSIKDSSVAKLGSVCRRVYRIFSHAYYHHRHIFDEFENESYLCRRFTVFVIKYSLMSRDNLIVPILDPSPKTIHGTSPVYSIAQPASTLEEDPSSSESMPQEDDDGPADENLSATMILRPDGESSEESTPSEQEEGFVHAGGTPDFATLRAKDKQKDPAAKPPANANNSNNTDSEESANVIEAGADLQNQSGENKADIDDPPEASSK